METSRQPSPWLPSRTSTIVSAAISLSNAKVRQRRDMLPRLASTRQFPLSFHRYTSRRDGLANRPFHQCFGRSTQVLEHTFYRPATRSHPPEVRDGGRPTGPTPVPYNGF